MGRRRRLRVGGRDRRVEERALFGGLFMNKFIDGLPHLAKVLDLSPGGMMIGKLLEPAVAPRHFAIELGIPWTNERFWLWARCIREWEDRQAVRFLSVAPEDGARLAAIVEDVRRVA